MSDKRSVSTDALETLGNIIEGGGRDAIHLAVEPIVAAEKLYPGQDIGIVDGKATTKTDKKLGIVDPFIKGFVPEGAMFWLVVYPRRITSLRHIWTHPEFDDADEKTTDNSPSVDAILWIQNYCHSTPWSYKTIMEHADYWATKDKNDYGDYLTGGSEAEGEMLSNEFWKYYEIVRGVSVPEYNKSNFFSCSC